MAAELGERLRIRASEAQPLGGRELREAAQAVVVVGAVLCLGAIGTWLGG